MEVVRVKYLLLVIAAVLVTAAPSTVLANDAPLLGYIEIMCYLEGDGLAWDLEVWGSYLGADKPPLYHNTYNPCVWEPGAHYDYQIWANRRSTFDGDQWVVNSTVVEIIDLQPWPARTNVYPEFEYIGE